ncbi:unnamed protein product [Somion occarium]|uniref:Aminoglycoside phosphotransferase domain-containing protein n=1 Tax=Somion occarium TaxID=3059160 RepID=A0ABP1D777_9APHY
MLENSWGSLSLFMQFRIACTMRRYIRQLQHLKGTVPGMPDGCVGGNLFFCNQHGPFKDSAHFQSFCEMVAQQAYVNNLREYRNKITDTLPRPPIMGGNWSLSFLHGDIHLGNLMLSRDGVLWLVDWGNSGFYPPWLESAYIAIVADTQPASWNRWRWFIAGRYPEYEHFWNLALSLLNRFWR